MEAVKARSTRLVEIQAVRKEFENILREIEGRQASVEWPEGDVLSPPRPIRHLDSPSSIMSQSRLSSLDRSTVSEKPSAADTLERLNRKYGQAQPSSAPGII